MTIALKRQHLERYKQIAQLLYKYGRRDVLREAGLEDPGTEQAVLSSETSDAPSSPAVHDAPGEILKKLRRQQGANGKDVRGAEVDGETDVDARHALAAQLADDLEAMGPTFIKLGQFLSTRGDLLPSAYIDALARLQDRVGPFPYADVERIDSEDWVFACRKRSRSSRPCQSPRLRSGRCIAPSCGMAVWWRSRSSDPTSASGFSRISKLSRRSPGFSTGAPKSGGATISPRCWTNSASRSCVSWTTARKRAI